MKKGLQTLCLQPFDPLSGAYRSRTDDHLTAREITSVTYPQSQIVAKWCKRTPEKDAVIMLYTGLETISIAFSNPITFISFFVIKDWFPAYITYPVPEFLLMDLKRTSDLRKCGL